MTISKNNLCLKAHASEKMGENVFNELRTIFLNNSLDAIEPLLKQGEEEYMEYLQDQGVTDLKWKSGKWKFGKHLPNSYQSGKSVLTNAVSLGIDVTNKGKSALQEEIKSNKTTTKKDRKPTHVTCPSCGAGFDV